MEREAVIPFEGKQVKLHYKRNNFGLSGWVKKVYKEHIFFQTDQASSLIMFDDIRDMVEV